MRGAGRVAGFAESEHMQNKLTAGDLDGASVAIVAKVATGGSRGRNPRKVTSSNQQ